MNNIDYLGQMSVHKFGGSSLSSVIAYKHVANLISKHCNQNDWVVVSAAGKTTNRLLSVMSLCSSEAQRAMEELVWLKAYQRGLINAAPEQARDMLLQQLDDDFKVLVNYISSAKQRMYSEAEWCFFGEVWSARLLAAVLCPYFSSVAMVDARAILRVNKEQVEIEHSHINLANYIAEHNDTLSVLTGFIASDHQGTTVTLGRNGSDYSASLITHLLNAKALYIWTDVAGVFSADPRLVDDALLIPKISRKQIQLLAQSGNTILHDRTLLPLQSNLCDIVIKSSLKPQCKGTVVTVGENSDVTFLSRTSRVCLVAENVVQSLDHGHVQFHLPSEQGGGAIVSLETMKQYPPQYIDTYSLVDVLVVYDRGCQLAQVMEEFAIRFNAYLFSSPIPFTLIVLYEPFSDENFAELHKYVCGHKKGRKG